MIWRRLIAKSVGSCADLWERTSVGPIPGQYMVLAGFLFNGAWIAFAIWTWREDREAHGRRKEAAMG